MQSRATRWLTLLVFTPTGTALCAWLSPYFGFHDLPPIAIGVGVPATVAFAVLWWRARRTMKSLQRESDDLFNDLEDVDPEAETQPFESGDYPTL